MKHVAFPFHTLNDLSLEQTVWEYVDDKGHSVALQKHFSEWDYLRDINIKRQIRINKSIAASQLRLSENALDLYLVVKVGTGQGTMPRKWIRNIEIRDTTGELRFDIDERISGNDLSNRLRLETMILSGPAPDGSDALAPRVEAAKVWSDSFDVSFEDSSPRFPMETMSFSKNFPGTRHVNSLWYLHWSPGAFHSDFGNSVRLYINSDHEVFFERFINGDPLTLQSIMAGIMSEIAINYLIDDPDTNTIEEYEAGTVGAYLNKSLSMSFPSESVSSIRSKLINNPSDFHAAILAAADMGNTF